MAQFYNSVDVDSVDKRKVRITSVDSENLGAIGVSNNNRSTIIDLNKGIAGILTIPNVGEEWVIQSISGSWCLYARTDWQNTLYSSARRPGEIKLGGTTRLTINAEQVNISSASSVENNAVMAIGNTGFVKYHSSPTGAAYCWGEVSVPPYSGTSVLKDLCVIDNLTDPLTLIKPTTRRFVTGSAAIGIGYGSTLIQIEADGRIRYWTVPNQTTSAIFFSASWFVEQP